MHRLDIDITPFSTGDLNICGFVFGDSKNYVSIVQDVQDDCGHHQPIKRK